MSFETGIIGLPRSGRTTVFHALTGAQSAQGRTVAGGGAPHIGVAKVPEPRLKGLADMLQPARVVPATVTYVDIGASLKGLVKDRGIDGQLLNRLITVDALLNVVRAFRDDSVPHDEGSLDVKRDITSMDLELIFSDLAIVERRLERIELSLKGAKPPERPVLLREQELLAKIKTALEKDVSIREMALSAEETRAIAGYRFLTVKPLLVVVNIGEDQLPQAESRLTELNSYYSRPKCRLVAICAKLEMELGQLDDSAAAELRAEFGVVESGADRVVKLAYELLGLISFFTTVSEEVRAWSVPTGTSAVQAAGKIHSDMEKGFIRAEVIGYDELVRCGSLPEARRKGLLRLEGKNYTVQDGDVITFLFNV